MLRDSFPVSSVSVIRVLVADDDREIIRLLETGLAARGFEVESAETGEAVIARLRDVPPDLIFLDVDMPGMNGLDVLAFIRRQQQHFVDQATRVAPLPDDLTVLLPD